jgi:YggT family protein
MIIASALVFETLYTTIRIYLLLLFIRVLLTWIPSINWMNQPFAALSQITDPYLNLFRSIIPPIGGFDLSPILAFLALQFVLQLLPPIAAATVGFM